MIRRDSARSYMRALTASVFAESFAKLHGFFCSITLLQLLAIQQAGPISIENAAILSSYCTNECSAAWRRSELINNAPEPGLRVIRSRAARTALLKREEQKRLAMFNARLTRLPTLLARSELYRSINRCSEKSASFPVAISLIK